MAANAAPVDEVDGTAIPVAWPKRDRVSGVAIEFSEGATDVATVPFIVGAMGACTVAAQVDEVDGTAIPVSGVAIEFSEGATDVATVPFIVGAMGTSVVAAQVDEVDGIMVPVAWLMRDRVSGVTVEYCGGTLM